MATPEGSEQPLFPNRSNIAKLTTPINFAERSAQEFFIDVHQERHINIAFLNLRFERDEASNYIPRPVTVFELSRFESGQQESMHHNVVQPGRYAMINEEGQSRDEYLEAVMYSTGMNAQIVGEGEGFVTKKGSFTYRENSTREIGGRSLVSKPMPPYAFYQEEVGGELKLTFAPVFQLEGGTK